MGLDSAIGINSERHRHIRWTKQYPKGLVGHWEFCTKLPSLNLFQDVAGTTPVNADGHHIGHVVNTAPGNNLLQKMGSFARSMRDVDSDKPVWKASGCGKCGYALFAGDGTSSFDSLFSGPMTGEDATNWGGETSTKLSDLVMRTQAWTTFAVVKNTTATASALRETVLQTIGRAESGDTDPSESRLFRSNSEKWNQYWVETTDAPVEDLVQIDAQIDTNCHLITVCGRSSAFGDAYLRIDGVEKDTEVLGEDQYHGFQSTDLAAAGHVAIGAELTATAVATGSINRFFTGGIYEILVYQGTLSQSAISSIEQYLMEKYEINQQVPVTTNLIGHWDFSDATTMFTDQATSTQVTTSGDDIGSIENKSIEATRLGNFLRSVSPTPAPHWITGGANGQSYALFNASNNSLLIGRDSAGYGGTTDGSEFSSADVSIQDRTAFAVFDPSTVTPGTDMTIFVSWGTNAGGNNSFTLKMESTDSGQVHVSIYYGGSPSTQAIDTNVVATTGVQLWSLRMGSTASIYKNGDTSLGVTGISTTNESQDYTDGAYGIGTNVNPAGQPVGGAGKFDGKIYEILEYSSDLSNSDVTNIENYLMNKYGIS
tara:strand:+ start:1753 stop:3546 length:1794 start_codon:yes stop_codon:yes gene_type:complete